MPERLNWVKVATARKDVKISWEAREQLLERVSNEEGGAPVEERFRAAGTSSPVELDGAGKRLLLKVLSRWIADSTLSQLPDGIYELRRALVNDQFSGELDSAG